MKDSSTSVSEAAWAAQRWSRLNSMPRTFAPVAFLTSFARKAAKPPSWAWPKLSLVAFLLAYSVMKTPSASWMPSDPATMHFLFAS